MSLLAAGVTDAPLKLPAGVVDTPLKMLSRVVRAQEQMTSAWEVLKTMTPADYLHFRHAFGQASGFQSAQYRRMEFLLGNRHEALLRPFEQRPDLHGPLLEALHAPSLYDLALRLLAAQGFALPPQVLARDFSAPYQGKRRGAGRLAERVPFSPDPLGAVRAGREVAGRGRQLPALALQPPHHRGAHHRL